MSKIHAMTVLRAKKEPPGFKMHERQNLEAIVLKKGLSDFHAFDSPDQAAKGQVSFEE
jgi:hypothetical protein